MTKDNLLLSPQEYRASVYVGGYSSSRFDQPRKRVASFVSDSIAMLRMFPVEKVSDLNQMMIKGGFLIEIESDHFPFFRYWSPVAMVSIGYGFDVNATVLKEPCPPSEVRRIYEMYINCDIDSLRRDVSWTIAGRDDVWNSWRSVIQKNSM